MKVKQTMLLIPTAIIGLCLVSSACVMERPEFVTEGASTPSRGDAGVISENEDGGEMALNDAGFAPSDDAGSTQVKDQDAGINVIDVQPITPLPETPAVQSRLPRLSHTQYENTLRDLFGLEDESRYADDLRPDSQNGGALFERYGELRVDNNLWQGYRRVAEEVARSQTRNEQLVQRLAPANSNTEARRDLFIREQGKRFHRRMLSLAEVERYQTLFEEAPNFYNDEGMSNFAKGVRALIEVWLQSPYFLYRPELSTTSEDAVVLLDDFETASRLSYAIWGTMPDDILFGAAQRAELQTRAQVEAQARRLLTDSKADKIIGEFHTRLFGSDAYESVQPPESFSRSAEFGSAMVEENNRFIEGIFQSGGGLDELLTSRITYVNAELANVYGLEGDFSDENFTEVTLDEDRLGILTRSGFLSKNAAGGQPDPIHRGVFISTKVACNIVPAPPDDIPAFPNEEGLTNREQIEALTEVEGTVCYGCHTSAINNYGFPLEHYDAAGGFRERDRGFEIDTSSLLYIDGETLAVDGAASLMQTLAQSQQVHTCYATHWMNFLYGREKSDTDSNLLARIGNMSLQDRASWVDLIVALVTSDAFRFRNIEEVE